MRKINASFVEIRFQLLVRYQKIIKKIDSIAKEMEKNQRQSVKVTKSRLKEISKSKKDFPVKNKIPKI